MKTNVVYVDFDYNQRYPYLNDRFNLEIGDAVYVDGKLAGRVGIVTEIVTQFKASLKYYKHVIAKVDYDIHGTFEKCGMYYVSNGDSVPFEQLLLWVKGPDTDEEAEEEEFICGEGYEISLDRLDSSDNSQLSFNTYQRGKKIAYGGAVHFISVKDGVGKAIVQYYGEFRCVEFDFDIKTKTLSNAFCTCIYPKLCEDIAAVAIILKKLTDEYDALHENTFTVIEQSHFETAIAGKDISVTL